MKKSAIALGVIPARAHSSRFPFKSIAKIAGRPMLQYVWENAQRCKTLARVLIATDHAEIARVVESFGGACTLTPEFESGSDRVAFIAKDSPEEIIVNIQGDEPLLSPEAIDHLVGVLEENPAADLATLATPLSNPELLKDSNTVKVVINLQGEALYFSRAPIASRADGSFLKHIGIYAYRKNSLLKFCTLPQSALELTEKLEQLRALENGMRIQVVLVEKESQAVDAPEDIERVEAILAERTKQ